MEAGGSVLPGGLLQRCLQPFVALRFVTRSQLKLAMQCPGAAVLPVQSRETVAKQLLGGAGGAGSAGTPHKAPGAGSSAQYGGGRVR